MAKKKESFLADVKEVSQFQKDMRINDLNNINHINDINRSSDLGDIDQVVSFGTKLPESLILRLKKHSYWNRQQVKDIITDAITEYLNKFPETDKELPAGVLDIMNNKGRKKKK